MCFQMHLETPPVTSSSPPMQQGRRSRPSVLKFRTGCPTWKIRKIECDEQKPICLRCGGTGRVCDGDMINKRSVADTTKSTQVSPLSASTIAHGPAVSTIGNDEERRSFDFFQCRLAPELARALDPKFWYCTVFQFCHYDSVVRHAMIALGSLGEWLEMNTVLGSDNGQANSRHDFACHQYHRAIRQLRERIGNGSEQSAEFTLICCFLFTCFEFLQNNDVGAFAHLRSGLNILSRPYSEEPEPADNVLSNDKPSHNIRRIFAILNLIARRWLGLQSIQSEGIPPIEGPKTVSPISTSFSSLEEAEDFLIKTNRMYYFGCSVAAHGDWQSSEHVRLTALANRQDLILQVNRWPLSMEDFLERIGRENNPADLRRVTFLSIRHKVITVLLTASLQSSPEAAYEHLGPVFEDIVSLAATLIRPVYVMVNEYPHISHFMLNAFDLTEGVIQALYFTAVNCRNRNICLQAVSLLSSEPWREGAWDSVGMAKIAKRRMRQLEETGNYYI